MSSVIIFIISITHKPQVIGVQNLQQEKSSITISSLKNLSENVELHEL